MQYTSSKSYFAFTSLFKLIRKVLYTATVGKLRIYHIKNAYVRLPYTAKKSFFASATLKTLMCGVVI